MVSNNIKSIKNMREIYKIEIGKDKEYCVNILAAERKLQIFSYEEMFSVMYGKMEVPVMDKPQMYIVYDVSKKYEISSDDILKSIHLIKGYKLLNNIDEPIATVYAWSISGINGLIDETQVEPEDDYYDDDDDVFNNCDDVVVSYPYGFDMKFYNTINDSIKVHGPLKKVHIAMEEMGELIQAISKNLRGEPELANITEEIADVTICLEYLKLIYNINDHDIDDIINRKVKRQVERDKEFVKAGKTNSIKFPYLGGNE